MTKLKNHLQEMKISQADLCRAVGASESHISNIVSGKRQPSYALARKISKFCGLPLAEIADVDAAGV